MISSVRNAEVKSPPTMGAATRFITSAPAPCDQSRGTRPIIIVATVISSGRTRCTEPSSVASTMSSKPWMRPSASERR